MAAIEPSAKISEAKLSPTVSTNTTVVCKVCTCLLQSPGILPCLHHICVDWLCLHIQQSGRRLPDHPSHGYSICPGYATSLIEPSSWPACSVPVVQGGSATKEQHKAPDMWICLTQLKGFDAQCKNMIWDVPRTSVMPDHWPKEERQQGNKNYTYSTSVFPNGHAALHACMIYT
jgi:hypothetical protein